MAIYIVLLGPPGAGKGTQAKLVSESLGLPHISSGDLFRANISGKTELGILAQKYMDRGELVPDSVTIKMIEERLGQLDCRDGALLDGFPRTPSQADALSVILNEYGADVNWVPYISVPEIELVDRLTGRWTCRTNPKHIYNVTSNPPARAGYCDHDGGELFQREDDKTETVKNRIQVYFTQTMPLIEYYRRKGVLVEVDGGQPIEKVGQDLLTALSN